MKRKILILLLLIATCCLFTACQNESTSTKLDAPQNVRTENSVVICDKVENADEYTVFVNNEEYTTSKNYLDLSILAEGTYTVEIKAYGEGYGSSDCASYTFLRKIPTEGLQYTYDSASGGYSVSRGDAMEKRRTKLAFALYKQSFL